MAEEAEEGIILSPYKTALQEAAAISRSIMTVITLRGQQAGIGWAEIISPALAVVEEPALLAAEEEEVTSLRQALSRPAGEEAQQDSALAAEAAR
jgi:hypothetical protein